VEFRLWRVEIENVKETKKEVMKAEIESEKERRSSRS
jgi:hypothetical protein